MRLSCGSTGSSSEELSTGDADREDAEDDEDDDESLLERWT